MWARLAHNQRQPIGRIGRPGTVLVINRGDIQECAFFRPRRFFGLLERLTNHVERPNVFKAQLVGLPGTLGHHDPQRPDGRLAVVRSPIPAAKLK